MLSPAAFEGVDLLDTVERLSIPSYAIDPQGLSGGSTRRHAPS
jgi:hypothetical protein